MYTEAWMVLLLKQGDETPCGHQTPPSMEALGCGGGGGGGGTVSARPVMLSLWLPEKVAVVLNTFILTHLF